MPSLGVQSDEAGRVTGERLMGTHRFAQARQSGFEGLLLRNTEPELVGEPPGVALVALGPRALGRNHHHDLGDASQEQLVDPFGVHPLPEADVQLAGDRCERVQ